MSHSHYGVIKISKEELAKLLGFPEGRVIEVDVYIYTNQVHVLIEDDGFPEVKRGQSGLEYSYPPDKMLGWIR